jgi:phage terminase small subunit
MLTAKQEKFVQCIIEGMSQADAYRSAYSAKRMSDKTIHEAASRLMSDSKIVARLTELRDKISNDKIMSATRRAEKLTEFATADDPNIAMKAIDLLNKMTGEYVQKVEANVNADVNINIELSDDE